MCGISVTVTLGGHLRSKEMNGVDGHLRSKISKELDESLETIAHRGPDSRGKWFSEDNRDGKLAYFDSYVSKRRPFQLILRVQLWATAVSRSMTSR